MTTSIPELQLQDHSVSDQQQDVNMDISANNDNTNIITKEVSFDLFLFVHFTFKLETFLRVVCFVSFFT